jgi:hypothetical protein
MLEGAMHRFTRVFVLVIAAALAASCAGNPGYSQSAYYDGSGPYQDGQRGWVAAGGVREERRSDDRAHAGAQRANQKTPRANSPSPQRSSAPAAKAAGHDDDHK